MMQKILKGDTSGQISLSLADGFDYTGATVEVIYQGVVRKFSNCTAGQTLTLAFTSEETAPMALGAFPLTVRIVKQDGTRVTVTNAGVKIAVTDCIGEVRAGSTIAVDVHGGLYGVDDLPANYTIKDLRAKINEIIAKLGGGAVASCLIACACFAGTVQTAKLEDLTNSANVVTNVTFEASVSDLAPAINYTTAVSNKLEASIASKASITNRIADAAGNEVWADGMWVEAKRGFGVGYWTMRGNVETGGETVVCDKWMDYGGYGYGWFEKSEYPNYGVCQNGSFLTPAEGFPSIPMDFGKHTVTNEYGNWLEVEYHAGIFTNTIAATSITNGLARASEVATNTANIATNAANIATNAANIATNAANIATNAANIETRTTVADVDDLVSVKVYGADKWNCDVTNLVDAVIDNCPAYFEEGQGWYFEPYMIYNGKQWIISGYITYLEGDGTENYLTTTQTFYDINYQNEITANIVLRRNYSINRYGLATTNALASSIALAADYALTNLTGAANISLASGTMANVTLDAANTNLYLTLNYPTANDRSCDICLRAVVAADTRLHISNANTDVDGTDWTLIKAGTNRVLITRTAYVGGRSIVSATVQEVK